MPWVLWFGIFSDFFLTDQMQLENVSPVIFYVFKVEFLYLLLKLPGPFE